MKGDFNAAITNYGKVIALNSKEPAPYMNRGIAHYNQKNFDSAIADFSKVVELNPNDATAYFKRGDAFERIGKVQKAVEDYQKAVDLEADNELAKSSLERLQGTKKTIIVGQTKPETAEKTAEKTAENIVDVGSLKEMAVKLAVPLYPSYERLRRTEGVVTVQVTLDENGKVIEATATSGPKTLRQFAEDAIKKSKFNPAKVNDQPVKSRGYVAYNFKVS
ncbi:MAG: TonB family protein [Pyrinomonadaceae bacterium]|nr:TonB family protein [Pyrinomonadaceae bacterium]